VLAPQFGFIANSCWTNAALRWDEDAYELVLTALEDIGMGACVRVGSDAHVGAVRWLFWQLTC
jgi:hypothetical protein